MKTDEILYTFLVVHSEGGFLIPPRRSFRVEVEYAGWVYGQKCQVFRLRTGEVDRLKVLGKHPSGHWLCEWVEVKEGEPYQ